MHKDEKPWAAEGNMLRVKHRGDWSVTTKFLNATHLRRLEKVAQKYGKKGVEALAAATPKDTGKTSESWYYEVTQTDNKLTITWLNSNINHYVNIALILQYGHVTGTGGWVQGRDYINPAIQPIFDEMAEHAWKEVTSE